MTVMRIERGPFSGRRLYHSKGLTSKHRPPPRSPPRSVRAPAPPPRRLLSLTSSAPAAMDDDADTEKRWAGGELLACAVVQLALVHVAYRIDRHKSAPLLSTSSWAIIFGLLSGALLSFMSERRVLTAGLDPQILFFGLLPPIILEAGFNTQRKGFFSNFWAILLLAIVGTLIATFVTGGLLVWMGQRGWITPFTDAEAFLYGSLISAIDPVATLLVFKKCKAPPLLFNLVFGESVLNDAVAIVIFTLFQNFVSSGNTEVTAATAMSMVSSLVTIGIGSVVLAAAVCYTSAYVLHNSDPALREHPTYEISIILLSAYASYVAADLCDLSGLLAVFFSGVFIRHYHMYNISPVSASSFEHLLSTIAFLAENFIYLYLGISVIAYRSSFVWDWGFAFGSLGVLFLARALNTFPLCAAANFFRADEHRIPAKYMVVIWFSGLRGAIAFALALNIKSSNAEHTAILKSSTLFTVIFTTVFLSAGTGPLLRLLKLDNAEDVVDNIQPRSARSTSIKSDYSSIPASPVGAEGLPLLSTSNADSQSRRASQSGVHKSWVGLDETYLKPLFGGNPRPRTDSMVSM